MQVTFLGTVMNDTSSILVFEMTLSTVVYWISLYFEYVPPRILEVLSKSISLRNRYLTRIEMAGNIFR